MEKKPNVAAQAIIRVAGDAGALTFGELITPCAMGRRVAPGAFEAEHLRGWFITGEMSRTFLREFERGEAPKVSSVVRIAASSQQHFVAQLRIKNAVHRFVVPCAGDLARQFSQDMGNDGFGIGLWANRGNDLHISLLDAQVSRPIPTAKQPESQQQKEQMTWGLLNAAAQLLLPLPLIYGEARPQSVNLTIVVPEDISGSFDAVLASSMDDVAA